MITAVQDIYYNITDRARAVKFYTEGLQMKLLSNEPYWVALDCHGIRIGLHPEESITRVSRDSHGAHGQATLTLRSDNVQDDRLRIEKAGGKILGVADQPWGEMVAFEDPDGNVLKLMKPKY